MKKRLLFLPGYACTDEIWKDISIYFDDDFDSISINWPGELTPHFDTVRQFSDWFRTQYQFNQDDILVGHSLGGLVALDLITRISNATSPTILVESFLTPPSPFFQNLLMPGVDPALTAWVTAMLQTQKQNYSCGLSIQLREVNLTNDVLDTSAPIYSIYGDRGNKDHDQVYAELNWSDTIRSRVDIKIVSNACHFPMLENPDKTIQILRSILCDFI
jgi:pimeloyl-ACP methyl ester carboxylesterase